MQTSTKCQQHEGASASAWVSLPTRHGAGQCRGKEQESDLKLARRRNAAREARRSEGNHEGSRENREKQNPAPERPRRPRKPGDPDRAQQRRTYPRRGPGTHRGPKARENYAQPFAPLRFQNFSKNRVTILLILNIE